MSRPTRTRPWYIEVCLVLKQPFESLHQLNSSIMFQCIMAMALLASWKGKRAFVFAKALLERDFFHGNFPQQHTSLFKNYLSPFKLLRLAENDARKLHEKIMWYQISLYQFESKKLGNTLFNVHTQTLNYSMIICNSSSWSKATLVSCKNCISQACVSLT